MKIEGTTTLKEIIVALACSIDLTSFFIKHHHQRVAIIAMNISKAYGLSDESKKKLILSASLHDIGAISAKERDELRSLEVENPYTHARFSAIMLKSFPFFKDIIPIIENHHCKWTDAHDNIPIESYFLHLADRIEILIDGDIWILDQKETVRETIKKHSGSLFCPEIVDAFLKASDSDEFWLNIDNYRLEEVLSEVLEDSKTVPMNLDLLESLANTITRIIDFRSEFTATHSVGVGEVAYALGKLMLFSEENCRRLKIAGLLHDFGKISVPNEIINKQTKLTESELNRLRAHSYYTDKILSNIPNMKEIGRWASSHHERHDGTGYPKGLKMDEFTDEIDIIAYADVFTALREDRPYRKAYDLNQTIQILGEKFSPIQGAKIFALIKINANKLEDVRLEAQKSALKDYREAIAK